MPSIRPTNPRWLPTEPYDRHRRRRLRPRTHPAVPITPLHPPQYIPTDQFSDPSWKGPGPPTSPSKPSACPYTRRSATTTRSKSPAPRWRARNGSISARWRCRIWWERTSWSWTRWMIRGRRWSMQWGSWRRMLRRRGRWWGWRGRGRNLVYSYCMWVWLCYVLGGMRLLRGGCRIRINRRRGIYRTIWWWRSGIWLRRRCLMFGSAIRGKLRTLSALYPRCEIVLYRSWLIESGILMNTTVLQSHSHYNSEM